MVVFLTVLCILEQGGGVLCGNGSKKKSLGFSLIYGGVVLCSCLFCCVGVGVGNQGV